MNWTVPERLIRPLVPPRLELDVFESQAWITITPFAMSGIRPNFLPAVPVLSNTLELNVRTYVRLDGVPGVWFLSLDASNPLAVWGARFSFHLPYFQAEMHLADEESTIRFRSRRVHINAPAAELDAAWVLGDALPNAEPGSIEYFLAERYCLYAEGGKRLSRARIFHEAWPLRTASLLHLDSTMMESHGLPTPDHSPLVFAQRSAIDVEIWAPEEV